MHVSPVCITKTSNQNYTMDKLPVNQRLKINNMSCPWTEGTAKGGDENSTQEYTHTSALNILCSVYFGSIWQTELCYWPTAENWCIQNKLSCWCVPSRFVRNEATLTALCIFYVFWLDSQFNFYLCSPVSQVCLWGLYNLYSIWQPLFLDSWFKWGKLPLLQITQHTLFSFSPSFQHWIFLRPWF